jgi:hypothetical protein
VYRPAPIAGNPPIATDSPFAVCEVEHISTAREWAESTAALVGCIVSVAQPCAVITKSLICTSQQPLRLLYQNTVWLALLTVAVGMGVHKKYSDERIAIGKRLIRRRVLNLDGRLAQRLTQRPHRQLGETSYRQSGTAASVWQAGRRVCRSLAVGTRHLVGLGVQGWAFH